MKCLSTSRMYPKQYKLALLRTALASLSCIVFVSTVANAQPITRLENPRLRVKVTALGAYDIHNLASGMRLAGELPSTPTAIHVDSGTDSVGRYHQVDISYGSTERVAVIRLYDAGDSVLFLDKHSATDPNTAPFPTFHILPMNLMRASYRVVPFSPIQFSKLNSMGPWLFFNSSDDALVVSPANNFLVASLTAGSSGVMHSGIDGRITTLPSHFQHETLVTFGRGINHTLENWGRNLQLIGHKRPVPNDADLVLAKFGYWTDNGAHYYYRYDRSMGYEGTLLAVRDQFKKLGVPLAYMQLDSWWYPKAKGDNPGGDNGETIYRADPTIFPDGLPAFHKRMGLPFVTHARWVSPHSPYRLKYRMSRNVIIDPRFWRSTADYLHKSGVIGYEQDWLNYNARPAISIEQSHAFLADMAKGMARKGIGIQYCMALPGYFMASTEYGNVRTIRSSDDRFIRPRWDSFLYTSEFAHSVGLWPWCDVFMSNELPNLVIATLSAGPVGTGDHLGNIDAANLKRAMRADSVLLKPDAPLAPIDAMYVADASATTNASRVAMVAQTETDFASATEHYVFAYPRVKGQASVNVPLGQLGISSPVFAWNWVSRTGELLAANATLHMPFVDGWSYFVIVPVNRAGIALLGDTSKIAPLARKRFISVQNQHNVIAVIHFAKTESSVPVTGYSKLTPVVKAESGSTSGLTFDSLTHLFTFIVHPDRNGYAKVNIG